ncbi:hypothetical protein [Streptomyces mirabilis]|uniref:hypothetical protein n=1 Tax=Streptomyces mirabilis TaxID=68239 RepID=UPI0034499A74
MRMVGLSATVSNADDVAGWLGARVIRIAWWPSRLSDRGVLVFCGSKYSVRATALAIAASRGVNTARLQPDDLEQVLQICRAVRIGLHYKVWEYKREAERDFRAHEVDVLVATSTVDAGVNLSAWAVVVRDTQIDLRDVDVATGTADVRTGGSSRRG